MARIAKEKLRVSRDEFYDAVMAEVNAAGLSSINASIRRKALGAANFSYLKDGALIGLDLSVLDTTQPGSIVDICRAKGGGGADYEVTFSSQNSKKEIVTTFTLEPDPSPLPVPAAPAAQGTGIPSDPYGTGRTPPAPRYDPMTGIPIAPAAAATGQYYSHGMDSESAMLRAQLEATNREIARLKEERAEERRKADLELAEARHTREIEAVKTSFQKAIDDLKTTLAPKADAAKPDREVEMMRLSHENARLQAEGQWKQIEALMKASDANFVRLIEAQKADREAATKIAEIREDFHKAELEIRTQMSDPSRMANSLDSIGKFAANMIALQVQTMERLGENQPAQTMNPYVAELIKNGKELLQKLIPQTLPQQPPPHMLPPMRPPMQATAQANTQLAAMPSGVSPVGSLPASTPIAQSAAVSPPPAPVVEGGLVLMRDTAPVIKAVIDNIIDNLKAKVKPADMAALLFNHLDYLRSIKALPKEMAGIFENPDAELRNLASFYEIQMGDKIEADYLDAMIAEFKKVIAENDGNGGGGGSEATSAAPAGTESDAGTVETGAGKEDGDVAV